MRVGIFRSRLDQAPRGLVGGSRVDLELGSRQRLEQLRVVRIGRERRLEERDRVVRPPCLVQRFGAQDDVAGVAQTSFLRLR